MTAAVLVSGVLAICPPIVAQAGSGCAAGGYQVVARTWDAVLKTTYELRQSCSHPGWPAYFAAVRSGSTSPVVLNGIVIPKDAAPSTRPLLVHAGDPVRLWMQDEMVRIEMTGEAEQSARNGEHVIVRVVHQSDDGAIAVERISGIVRGPGDVEMER